ncbi:hypothetical protein [Bacillus sp. B15-48]|uniref:hypothetical protein n=1 Tax=Bacillus sp. B15-48 TaxID=1548601 RepID=UPI00193FAE0C|nr:hypothetical protein [Bacillus sp. B15-48]
MKILGTRPKSFYTLDFTDFRQDHISSSFIADSLSDFRPPSKDKWGMKNPPLMEVSLYVMGNAAPLNVVTLQKILLEKENTFQQDKKE